ncbi:MAG TPA: electron transport complex subunit RsxE [Planctomycetota bacterium]|nr:electron transport complex subunit RsxE [Planctomycetota bacterium]HRR78560.1 electron transport complex subunit RsxE [Planctomycetota bacterium]HRT94811.1 electron transport complex subunit RsxE [Planctomycetota bacterium]
MKIGELTKGFFRENPLFVIVLGVCPSLATSGSLQTALAMGAAVIFVCVGSNVGVSLLRKVIPGGVRIACFIVVISTFVTITDLFLKAYFPDISRTIGIFIPLIVVNCIMLGRAEAFASKNTVMDSLLDGIGMGCGYTLALLLMGTIRELSGNGSLFGVKVLPGYNPMTVMISPPGAFLLLGLLLGFFKWMQLRKAAAR